jgi:hypothetical protein
VATATEDDTVFDAPGDRRHDPNRVLEYTSAAAETEGQDGAATLTDLGSDIIAAIDRFEADADDPDPAALRVCVDSVAALTADNTDEEVFRFLHMTTSRIRQATGMGHYHFPVDRSAQAVHLFEPLFDAIVTVRSREGEAEDEHRWEFTNSDVTSEWIPL